MILLDGRVFGTTAAHRGMGNFVTQLITSLIRDGNEVFLILPKNTRRNFDYSPSLKLISIDFEDTEASAQIQELINSINPEIYIDATPFIPPMNSDFWGTKIVSVVFDLIPALYPSFYLTSQAAIDAYLNGLHRTLTADGHIFISESARKDFSTFFPNKIPSIVIQPEGELEFLDTKKSKIDIKILSSVGMHASKNPIELADALNNLANNSDNFQAKVVVSSSDWAGQFASLINVSKIEVYSELEPEIYAQFYEEANIYVHPSIEEGFGIPLVNAISAGCAVVLADTAINKEICKLESAYWFNPLRAGDLERVLKTAITNFRDNKLQISQRNPIKTNDFQKLRIALNSGYTARIVNWLGPLPPQNCGIADYSAGIIEQMPQNCEINYFSDQPPTEALYLTPNVRYFPLGEINKRRLISNEAIDIYQIAAAGWFKPYIQSLLTRDTARPAKVVLHDHYFGYGLYLLFGNDSNYFLHTFIVPEDDEVFFDKVKFAIQRRSSKEVELLLQSRPILNWLKNRNLEIFTHASTEHLGLASELFPMPSKIPSSLYPLKAIKTRQKVDQVILGCFGRLAQNKYILEVLEALTKLLAANIEATLLLVGEAVDSTYMQKVLDYIQVHNLQKHVAIVGFADDYKYWRLLKSVNILISLRDSSRGGLSAVLTNGVILGTPIIASDIPEHRNRFLSNISYVDNTNIPQNLFEAVLELRQNKEMFINTYRYDTFIERLFK